ncbi:hypothetical protein RQP46_003999 [Phenoliferia psychrophenolica]
MSFFNSASSLQKPPEPKDIEVPNLPTDSTSSIAFSPTADFLAVASWSNEVRIYEVNSQGQAAGKAAYNHEGPALCVEWSKDGSKVISGGADKAARVAHDPFAVFDMTTGQMSQVAQHDEPIKSVKWIDAQGQGLLATGSWDKTIKYWDLRSPTAIASVTLPERLYTMDVAYPLMVVGTAERHLQIFNLTQPTVPFKTLLSPLRWQTRVISCFPDATGYAVGTVEGRVAIQYVDEKAASTGNFTFKCHRKDTPGTKTQAVYAVNAISFHPYGTFSTAAFDDRGGPIASTSFNRSGTIFGYAVTQDWSSGHAGHTPGFVNKLMLHACKDEEVKKRAKK